MTTKQEQYVILMLSAYRILIKAKELFKINVITQARSNWNNKDQHSVQRKSFFF